MFHFPADTESLSTPSSASKHLLQLQQCYFLLKQALDADECELKDQALDLYTRAVDIALRTVSMHFSNSRFYSQI